MNAERLEFGNEVVCLGCGQHAAVLRPSEYGACLIEPKHRHDRFFTVSKPLQNRIGVRMRGVLEAPAHRDGIIENESHIRP